MRKIVKIAMVWFVLITALSVMPASNAAAVDTELFVHQSPYFTLTVPKWIDQESRDPNFVFNRKPTPAAPTALAISVSTLPAGKKITYKDLAPAFKRVLENQDGSDVKIIYGREIKLKDGSSAYEIEAKWKIGKWPFRSSLNSFVVVALRDNKSIWVCVSDAKEIGDNLKQYPLSLTFQ